MRRTDIKDCHFFWSSLKWTTELLTWRTKIEFQNGKISTFFFDCALICEKEHWWLFSSAVFEVLRLTAKVVQIYAINRFNFFLDYSMDKILSVPAIKIAKKIQNNSTNAIEHKRLLCTVNSLLNRLLWHLCYESSHSRMLNMCHMMIILCSSCWQ